MLDDTERRQSGAQIERRLQEIAVARHDPVEAIVQCAGRLSDEAPVTEIRSTPELAVLG